MLYCFGPWPRSIAGVSSTATGEGSLMPTEGQGRAHGSRSVVSRAGSGPDQSILNACLILFLAHQSTHEGTLVTVLARLRIWMGLPAAYRK